MQTSSTRLKKPLHIWIARILGFTMVLGAIGSNLAVLPQYMQKTRHEGIVRDLYHTTKSAGFDTVDSISSEAIQKGVGVGDRILNPEADTTGDVGTPVTFQVQKGDLPVREVTFERKPSDWTVWAGTLYGLSAEASIILALLFSIVPFVLGTIAALLIGWLKSDDWMALLSAIALTSLSGPPITNPYAAAFGGITVLLAFTWLILFPNGRFAPRWSWVFIIFLLPNLLFYTLLDLGILSYSISYPVIELLGQAFITLGGLGIVGVCIYRYRRIFSKIERLQTKWAILPFLVGFVPIVITNLFYQYYFNAGQLEKSVMIYFITNAMGSVIFALLPLGILFSVFRYRLYDVDTFVSRAIVYSSLTAILGVVGFAITLAINYTLKQSLGEQTGLLAVLISTLPVAALFNPVRERLQNMVDRRFKPEEIDFENTFIEFTSELRSLFTTKELSSLLSRHAVEQLQVTSASVFLNGHNGDLKHIDTTSLEEEPLRPTLDSQTLEKIRKGQVVSPDADSAQSLVIPLMVPRSRKPSLLGALVLGPRSQGLGYSTAMLKNLKKFGEEVGKAFYVSEVRGKKKQKTSRE
jgi:hypothetical protein